MSRVLIVEDEVILAMSIQSELQDMGHEVIGIADSADRAISFLDKASPEVVLMDIVIHGAMSGIDLTSLINEKYDIPVIYGTAHTDRTTIEKANRTKHFGILYKPYDQYELNACISRALAH
jgi:DNA-binding NtrC family response regulator